MTRHRNYWAVSWVSSFIIGAFALCFGCGSIRAGDLNSGQPFVSQNISSPATIGGHEYTFPVDGASRIHFSMSWNGSAWEGRLWIYDNTSLSYVEAVFTFVPVRPNVWHE